MWSPWRKGSRYKEIINLQVKKNHVLSQLYKKPNPLCDRSWHDLRKDITYL